MCFAVPWSFCSVPSLILNSCVTLSKALTISEVPFLGNVETIASLRLGQVRHLAPGLARQNLPGTWLGCLALSHCCPSSPLSVTLQVQKLMHSLCSCLYQMFRMYTRVHSCHSEKLFHIRSSRERLLLALQGLSHSWGLSKQPCGRGDD